MKWVPDRTGRFNWRPYYDHAELDIECENLISGFLKQKYGVSFFPISTDDLSVMLEQETSDLDLYADLSGIGEDVEGLTDFFPDRKPAVKISMDLSLDERKEHRLRTTLAHEYGHVKFHAFLWDLTVREKQIPKTTGTNRRYYRLNRKYSRSSCFRNTVPEVNPRCRRSRIIDAPCSDWMEWQAGYASGALLMPVSIVQSLVREFFKMPDSTSWLPDGSDRALDLTQMIAETFDVSAGAARARLRKLGILQKPLQDSHGLFDKAAVFSPVYSCGD